MGHRICRFAPAVRRRRYHHQQILKSEIPLHSNDILMCSHAKVKKLLKYTCWKQVPDEGSGHQPTPTNARQYSSSSYNANKNSLSP